MSEQKTKFEIACERFLDKQNLGELRAYGRHVGVENPTVHTKRVLIQSIIAVLMGEVAPVPRPTRGAPIKADYFDPKIEKEIKSYRMIYADSFFEEQAYSVTAEQAAAQMERLREELGGKENVLIVRSSEAENFEKSVVVGQVQMMDGVSCLVPLSGEAFSFKIVIRTEIIHDYSLREGDTVSCRVQESGRNYFSVTKILTINGAEPFEVARFAFDEEDVFPPEAKISLRKQSPSSVLAKYLDWFIPLGAGQRCLIYAPPKAGKSHMLQTLASMLSGSDAYEVFALLVEQPPETVSSLKRIVKQGNFGSTVYGESAQEHVFIAELVWKRAKRFAEMGKDVVLLIDGIVNLAEAFNEIEDTDSGKTPVQGLSSSTVRYVKKFFGAARNFEKKGSLTIIATAKHSTGNPIADFIASELLDMANCRIILREDLAVKRVYPAIDLALSSADQSEELLGEEAFVERNLRNQILPKLGEEKLHELLMQSESAEELLKKAKEIC